MSEFLHRTWEEGGPAAWLLSPTSALYLLGWWGYSAPFAWGLRKPQRLPGPVLCVGSLIAGGAGKTPVTLEIARLLMAMGRRVTISISGFGSERAKGGHLAPSGDLDPKEWGDETSLVRWLLPEAGLAVGKDRVESGQLAFQSDPDCVLLLDSGFQHLELAKTASILLDPPHPRNRMMHLAGPYRELRSQGRKRADLTLPGGGFEVRDQALDFGGNPPEAAHLLCAIGRPDRFVKSVESAGIRILERRLLPDHDALTGGTVFGGWSPETPVVVTGKDWVKLRQRPDMEGRRIVPARHSVRLEPEAEFQAWLRRVLGDS